MIGLESTRRLGKRVRNRLARLRFVYIDGFRYDLSALDQPHVFEEDITGRDIVRIFGYTPAIVRWVSDRGDETWIGTDRHTLLALDLSAAVEGSLPEAKGPEVGTYPGGLERARWHMREGLKVFERYLGRRPKGVWLSEGGVSDDALKLLDEFDMALPSMEKSTELRNTYNAVPEREIRLRCSVVSLMTR